MPKSRNRKNHKKKLAKRKKDASLKLSQKINDSKTAMRSVIPTYLLSEELNKNKDI